LTKFYHIHRLAARGIFHSLFSQKTGRNDTAGFFTSLENHADSNIARDFPGHFSSLPANPCHKAVHLQKNMPGTDTQFEKPVI
jgi:hypothetical protein